MIESVLVWNIHGLRTSRIRLKQLVNKWKVHIVVILEPFAREDKLPGLAIYLGFQSYCSNEVVGKKVWLLWQDVFEVDIIDMSDQFLTSCFRVADQKLVLTFVYAKCTYQERKDLWQALECHDGDLPWLVAGDFNIICNDGELIGGNPRALVAMEEFNQSLNSCGFLELPVKGRRLSWCNGQSGCARSWAHLDHVVMNTRFLRGYPSVSMEYVNWKISDHCPMIIRGSMMEDRYGLVPFKFQNMWTIHASFQECVAAVWREPVEGNGL
ncbi:hypothetical protein F2P56_002383 [Juglans regia]|uniref:Endonuclease/exonuclease/phosphatase domain-containing protein n=2 Tax=Juglans regia TaxID=51240 RepID=A0A833YA81_JUGRE|nr:uncharacterized protein LOC109008343 [Juglans regia]KAF5481754.1 hypothetical protein F2P56_002383 [Juglans regia]